jgi:putative oxidoreductase
MKQLQIFAAPLGRLLLAFMFFLSGITKISQYEGTQGYMEAMGVPGALLPLVILTEAVGGLAIILGFKTRLVAFGLAGFSALSAILFHADFSNQAEMTNFMKNFAIAGGFLTLVVHGGGAYSLDSRFQSSAAKL